MLEAAAFLTVLLVCIIILAVQFVEKHACVQDYRHDKGTGKRRSKQSPGKLTVHKGEKEGQDIQRQQYYNADNSQNTFRFFHVVFLSDVLMCDFYLSSASGREE